MSSLKDLRYEILQSKKIQTAGSQVTPRFVDRLIHKYRSALIHNYLSSSKGINPSLIQQIKCFGMEAVNADPCCTELIEGDCMVLKSKTALPGFIPFMKNPGITAIKPNNVKAQSLNISSFGSIPYVGNGRFNSKEIYFFVINNYLYATSKESGVLLIDEVTLYGVLDDPSVAQNYVCGTEPCWTVDSPYPIEQWMWEKIVPMIEKDILGVLTTPTDNTNDNQDITIAT